MINDNCDPAIGSTSKAASGALVSAIQEFHNHRDALSQLNSRLIHIVERITGPMPEQSESKSDNATSARGGMLGSLDDHDQAFRYFLYQLESAVAKLEENL